MSIAPRVNSANVVDNRYGRRRYGDKAIEEQPPERALDDDRDLNTVERVTDREALGSGFRLATSADVASGDAEFAYDFVTGQHGRIATVEGVACLGRDLAVRLARLGEDILGVMFSEDELSDLALAIQEEIQRDERVAEILLLEVQPYPQTPDTVLVELALRAENNEYHENVILLDTNPASDRIQARSQSTAQGQR